MQVSSTMATVSDGVSAPEKARLILTPGSIFRYGDRLWMTLGTSFDTAETVFFYVEVID